MKPDRWMIALALLGARTADAESENRCYPTRYGGAAFRDGSIEILRPDRLEGSSFAWERTSDLGQTIQPVLDRLDYPQEQTDQGLVLHPSPALDQLVLQDRFGPLLSFDAGGPQRDVTPAERAAVSPSVAFDSTGRATIAYVGWSTGVVGLALVLVHDASTGFGAWTEGASLADGPCLDETADTEDTAIAIVFDATDALWLGCSGARGASVYRLEGGALREVASLTDQPAARIAATSDADGPVFFLLGRDGQVSRAGLAADFELEPAGAIESPAPTGELFAADRRTWVVKATDSRVHVGLETEGVFAVEPAPLPALTGAVRIFDVAPAPLRILWGGAPLMVSERAADGWTDPVALTDGLQIEGDLCGPYRPPRDEDGGCGVAGGRPSPWWLAIGAAVLMRRRRRSLTTPDRG